MALAGVELTKGVGTVLSAVGAEGMLTLERQCRSPQPVPQQLSPLELGGPQ